MIKNSWDQTPFEPSILNRQIHVWKTWLHRADINPDQFAQSLSADERAAAKKFHFVQDRNRYIVSHGILRKILSLYLGISSEEISFTRDEFGKPALDSNTSEINFNISHSEDMALFAFTRKYSVGIDIEKVHAINDLQGVANSFLSTAEMKAFLDLPEELQIDGFFRAWTRKEALSKAIGKGISMPLEQMEVGVNPSKGPILKIDNGDKLERTNWKLIDLNPSPGYIGALAVENLEMSVNFYSFPMK